MYDSRYQLRGIFLEVLVPEQHHEQIRHQRLDIGLLDQHDQLRGDVFGQTVGLEHLICDHVFDFVSDFTVRSFDRSLRFDPASELPQVSEPAHSQHNGPLLSP